MKKSNWFADRPQLDAEKGVFIDMRHLQDDRRILKNPHKGWCWHYVESGFDDLRQDAQGNTYCDTSYRQGYERIRPDGSVEILDDAADFPCMDHLYMRFNWGDIEKAEGQLDWSRIDRIMEAWQEKGYAFALRPCTFMGSLNDATPAWVKRAGAKTNPYRIDGMDTQEPVYDDPVYLEKLENFLHAFGKKYDGDPRIAYIDSGTFGHWGENCASRIYPVEALRRHLELLRNAFHQTPLVMNYAAVINRMGCETVPGEGQALVDWAREQGFLIRNDSIGYTAYVENGNYHSILSPSLHDAFYENGPVVLEFVHHWAYENPNILTRDGEGGFECGYRMLAACERSRATYAGFHDYPRDAMRKYSAFLKYVGNRLGYWFFVEGMQIPAWKAGKTAQCTLYVSNRGFARCYHRYDLKLRLIAADDGAETIIDCPDADVRAWIPKGVPTLDNAIAQPLSVPLHQVKPGKYQLQMGLFDGPRPIQFGIFADYEQAGWLPIGGVTVEE